MYVTDVDTVPAGPFGGKLVVSMRALTPADAITATIVPDRYPYYHGRPDPIGLPAVREPRLPLCIIHQGAYGHHRSSYSLHPVTIPNLAARLAA